MFERCWGIGTALYFHGVWQWRVAYYDVMNDMSLAHHVVVFTARLRSACATAPLRPCGGGVTKHTNAAGQLVRRALFQAWSPAATR
ncbi:hypothetical protein PI125_g12732 [Phytophthora idaei]|nr:hypothetical protein PI125_g12732 [Phytophthora idaei]